MILLYPGIFDEWKVQVFKFKVHKSCFCNNVKVFKITFDHFKITFAIESNYFVKSVKKWHGSQSLSVLLLYANTQLYFVKYLHKFFVGVRDK